MTRKLSISSVCRKNLSSLLTYKQIKYYFEYMQTLRDVHNENQEMIVNIGHRKEHCIIYKLVCDNIFCFKVSLYITF